jgi:hypothetical protein
MVIASRAGSYAILPGLTFVLKPKTMTSRVAVAAYMLLFLTSCSNENLTKSEVEKIFKEKKVYPHVVEARIFINEESSVKKIAETGLDEEGYLTVQLTHTVADIGQSLVHFTDKAKPYLISKGDSIESTEIQLIRVAEENFKEVKDIQYLKDGTEAVVDYTVKVENITPFAVLLAVPLNDVQTYRTTFNHTENGWEWNGNSIPLKEIYCCCKQVKRVCGT